MANVIKMVIQFRRDHTENWLLHKDVIPAAGEPCYDLDLKTLKIGDGSTTYENLPAIGGVDVEMSADGSSIVLQDNVFKLAGFDTAETGAQPRKNAEGFIEWVIPTEIDSSVIENLATSVDNLNVEVSSIQMSVDGIKEIVTPSGEGAVTLLSRVESLEGGMEVLNGNETVEGSVLKIVKDEINAFANEISNDDTINTIKELVDYVATHGKEASDMVSDIIALQQLVGNTSVEQQIATQIAAADHLTKTEAKDTLLSKVEAAATLKHIKYEISSKPEGALVDYRDKEIRVMCPADTKWVKQDVGSTGHANMYYMGFKAYAPAGAVSFKEGDQGVIVDEMFDFNGDFAGTDEYGRNYSIVWLALASYDEATDTWTYFGKNSSAKKYIGWTYVVEWYDANGKVIDSDSIRINLSNESCHNVVEPYYMGSVVKGVSVGGTLLDIVDGKVEIPAGAGLKTSDEINIAEDGTLSIGTISFSKISQSEDEIITFDGGGAAG